MSFELRDIHTIPVYPGETGMTSWFRIVEADGEPIDEEPEKWCNIGVFENSQGQTVTAMLAGDPEDRQVVFN